MEYDNSEYPYYEYPENAEEDEEYSVYIYPGYSFERPVYMYIWGILVIITFLVNIVVISVLVRKKMRNPTNLILVAIAISDSLTGLVTLPTYWAVYSNFHPSMRYNYDPCAFTSTTSNEYDNDSASNFTGSVTDSTLYITPSTHKSSTMPDVLNISVFRSQSTHPASTTTSVAEIDDISVTPIDCEIMEIVSQEGYHIEKDLCTMFMISKYFLSKSFHTVSIWLTLFLSFQRFISVYFPFKAQKLFNDVSIIVTCVVICILAPLLHIYHIVNEKAVGGMCRWAADQGCGKNCIYNIVTFVIRHFLPCVLLIVFTVLFITQLKKSSSRLSKADSNKGNNSMHRRDNENRRISIIVTLIVVVFLIPEVPYGIFLLRVVVNQIDHTDMELETNRAVHLAYEISLVLSFHANFYIYTSFNRRFRKSLLKRIVFPFLSLFGVKPSFDMTSSVSSSRPRTAKTNTYSQIEMKNMINPSRAGNVNNTPETSACLNRKPLPSDNNSNERSTFLNEQS